MLVGGGAVWENDRGDGKSVVRDGATVVDFRNIKLMKLYIRKQLRTQNYIYKFYITTQILKTMKQLYSKL
jgi:hypothetical protein